MGEKRGLEIGSDYKEKGGCVRGVRGSVLAVILEEGMRAKEKEHVT